MTKLDVALMFPSKYLKAADLLGRQPTVRLDNVAMEELVMEGGVKNVRPVVTLGNPKTNTPIEKQLVLCKTNALAIALLLGSQEANDWLGKRVTLTEDTDTLRKGEVSCIRIVGSPDAAPEHAAAYARAWKGKRMKGALAGRLKLALDAMRPKKAPPVEPGDEEQEEKKASASAQRVENLFDDGSQGGQP